jgi:glutamyl-tRNA synthetase
VFGPSGQDAGEIGDMIIRRSDGGPLYHLAGVVDDIEMGITHVIRGADHHSNTPFHIAIYRALDATPPLFAHVPLIVGADGRKLSKRRDPVSVQHYRDEGYLAAALRNWLVRIGWSHGDQEIFSTEEIARLFDLASVHRAPGRAEIGKLVWLNQHYLKTLARHELLRELLPFLAAEAGRPVAVTPELERLVELLRERSKTLVEMARLARFLVVETPALRFDESAVRKHWKPEVGPVLSELRTALAGLGSWSEGDLDEAFQAVCARHGDLALGKLAQPVRVAVTGAPVSPGIFETLAVLGRERTLERLDAAIARIRAG